MKKSYLIQISLLLLLISCPYYLMAQLEAYGNVIPPSPRSTEFEKFINYKVSLSNGLPEIGINFYNIQVDNVTIPIGISYHASGIKYGQSNGDVGLGWGLSSAYRASRTVYGRVDEAYGMPDMNNVANGMAIRNYLNNGFSTPYLRDKYLARYVNPREQSFVTALQNDYLDGQYDIFTVGLPSQSGNFIITDRVNKTVTMLNNSGLNVNYTTSDIGIDGFNITDINGIKYRLGQNEANSENLQISSGGVMKKYSSAWMISDITTPFNNVISFQYQPFQETKSGTLSYSRTLKEGAFYAPASIGFQGTDASQETVSNSSVYNTCLLSVINGVYETATFNRNTNGTISDIQIRKKNNDLLKKITFYYSQFASRVFLDSIKVAGADGISKERYKFDYKSKEISYNYYDNFNYYQSSALSGYAPVINGLYYFQNAYYGNFTPSPLSTPGSNRESYVTTDIYMLKKITYPTGGSVSYAYEPNYYKADGDLVGTHGGGMRVWSITSDDGSGTPILQHTYSYGDDGQGSGKMLFNINDPKLLVKESIVPFINSDPGQPTPLMLTRRRTINTNVDGDLADGYVKDNMGWYNKVTEVYNDGSAVDYFFTMPYYSGGIESFITNQSYNYSGDTQLSVTSPSYYVKGYHFWKKPMLSEQNTYAKNAVLKKKELFSYSSPTTDDPSNQFVGLKVSAFAVATGSPFIDLSTQPNIYEYLGINSLFNYDTYIITRGDVLLTQKTVYDYDGTTDGIKTVYNYDYTTGNLTSEEKMSTSNGQVLTTRYKYPSDFIGIVSADRISAGIKQLQLKNILSPVIEKSSFRSNADGANELLISSTFTSYKPTLPTPDKIFKAETTSPLSGFSGVTVNGGAIVKNAVYKENMTVDSCDSKGRILSVSRPGSLAVNYLWGYNNQYPVAKVVGSNYATISALVDLSILNNPLSDEQLRVELNKIRTALIAVAAQVTTYTYTPLVGLTSSTDPQGMTTTYEYDSFQRLINIKDKDGNIVKHTDYHYQAQ